MSILSPGNTTLGDICSAAMRNSGRLGTGQTANAQDLQSVWAACQMMLQEWQQKRWMVYHLRTYSIVSTGATSYTFGPGGQINTNSVAAWTLTAIAPLSGYAGSGYVAGDTIDLAATAPSGTPTDDLQVTVATIDGSGGVATVTLNSVDYPAPLPNVWTQSSTSGVGAYAIFGLPTWELSDDIAVNSGSQRPAKIASAFLRQINIAEPNQVDYYLNILQSHEDYDKIALKQLQSFSGSIFLDSSWPLANLFCYPVPQSAVYSINVTVMENLQSQFATAATVINLPAEYYSAVVYNLALRCRPLFQIPSFPGDPLPGLATNALATVRGPNTQIAKLVMPAGLPGSRPNNYNIFSDRS